MYKKKANTSQDNTGNSKKRKLKYELYDANKTEDDYSMTMDGGANPLFPVSKINRLVSSRIPPTFSVLPPISQVKSSPILSVPSAPPPPSVEPYTPPPPVEPYTPPPSISSKEELNKKVIFYDEQGEIDKFINDWFAEPSNFKKVNEFNVIDMTATISKFKTEFADTSSNYDKLLGGLLFKFTKYTSQDIAEIQNSNIFTNDYISTILTQLNNEDNNTVAVFKYDLYLYNLDTILENYKNPVYDKFTKFFNATYFKKHIENAKNLFGVNAIIETIDKDQGQQIKMYIPKLLTKNKSNIARITGQAGGVIEPYDIKTLKTLENSNKTKASQNKTLRTTVIENTELWNTVLNDREKYYGFEGNTPKNLMDVEFTLANDKAIIERYFRKCNDLQQLYINKHIELHDIFTKMRDFIELNDAINEIIKKLLDPKYFNSKGKDGKLKLPKPEITAIQDLLRTQYMVKKVVDTLYMTDEEKQKYEEKKAELDKMTTTGSPLGPGSTQGLSPGSGLALPAPGSASASDKTNVIKDKYIVDNIVDYEFLQLIKQIQLSNEQSIKQILGKKSDDTKSTLDTLINDYKTHINDSYYKSKNTNTKDKHWDSFDIDNSTSPLYFTESETLGQTSSNTEEIQKVIYKCYDLQIVYLVKHIEVIEMFKLLYYYYDMMIKKIGILFFILSLYHKSNINIEAATIHLPFDTIKNVKPMIKNQTNLLNSTKQIGGASSSARPSPDTIEQIIEKLKTEIIEYRKDPSKYTNSKTNIKNEAISKIQVLLNNSASPPLELFNTLLTYFKAFSDDQVNLTKYDYIDKLLIKLLKAILPEIAKTKDNYNTNEAKNIFNVVKGIYYDIIDQEIKIHQKQDSVKKERSSYGVVKIGQFSKMDYDISKTIVSNFKQIFKYRIKDEIEYSKASNSKYENLGKLTKEILTARSLVKEVPVYPTKKEDLKQTITEIETMMSELFNSVGGALSKLKYISDAIEKNKLFDDQDIPTSTEDSQHIRTSLFEEYRLNFLDLLKQVYFPTDGSVNLKNMTSAQEIELLNRVLQKVRYRGQANIDINDNNVIYIKKITYTILDEKNNDEKKRKEEDANRKKREEEAKRQRLEEEKRRKEAAAEAERNRLAEEAAEAERKRLAELAASLAEQEKKKRREFILQKIKEMMNGYTQDKQEDTNITEELKAYRINTADANNGYNLLTSNTWWKKRQNETEKQITPDDDKIFDDHYGKLLSILQSSALIYVNLTPKPTQTLAGGRQSGGAGVPQDMFTVDYNKKTITFKPDGVCNPTDTSAHGPYELIFPEQSDKNDVMYQTLFDVIPKDSNDKTVNFNVNVLGDKALQKQELMNPLNDGKSVVLFGFGFSGSGKTYTLIEGGKGDKDTSILYQFINKNSDRIQSIDFIEIYPDPNKPTFFVGSNNNQKTTLNQIITSNNITANPIYDTIQINNETSIETIKGKIASIETHRRSQLRILPTPNNSNSSRSFLQITIKLKDGIKKGGQLVIFDMPGTESTVRIKEMMLGTDSYVDSKRLTGEGDLGQCVDFNGTNVNSCFKFNAAAQTFFMDGGNQINYQDGGINKNICSQLYRYLTYKHENGEVKAAQCSISNLFEGFDESIKKIYLPNQPTNESIFNNITIKYTKQYDNSYTISSVCAIKTDDIARSIINVLFKYFILNIYKFYALGITFNQEVNLRLTEDKHKTQKEENRKKANKYIAEIGFELACFFNKKAYSTHTSYFNTKKDGKCDELIFLKDKDYKEIYDTFLNVILIEDNFDNTIELYTELNDAEKNKMKEVFEFATLTVPSTNTQFHLTDDVYNQKDKVKQLHKFLTKDNRTKTKSIFIKYILFILSYIKQKSIDLETKILGVINADSSFTGMAKTYLDKSNPVLVEISTLESLYNAYLPVSTEWLQIKKIKDIENLLKSIEDVKDVEDVNKKKIYGTIKDEKVNALSKVKHPLKTKINTLKEEIQKELNLNEQTFRIIDLSVHDYFIQASKTLNTIKTNKLKELEELNINPTSLSKQYQAKLDYISAKANYDIENMRLRASVYFIYKYIKFIVNQGSGVMTTLEHLKFFFLSRAGKIKAYNASVEPNKKFIIEGKIDIFNNRETYKNTKGQIEEEINIGEMKRYGLISILQSLAGDETNLDTIKTKKLADTFIPNLLTTSTKATSELSTKSKFIMLAHINPFPNVNDLKTDTLKKCNSAVDTLDYIDSISANNIQVQVQRAGYYPEKKYYKDIKASLSKNLKQHRIKRFTTLKKSKHYKKKLFTSKTKKQF